MDSENEKIPPEKQLNRELWMLGYLKEEADKIITVASNSNLNPIQLGRMLLFFKKPIDFNCLSNFIKLTDLSLKPRNHYERMMRRRNGRR